MPAQARGASLRRTVRSWGGKAVRRLRILPAGTPDGLGDDERLQGHTLQQEVVVFFPDTLEGLYQLRQWYEPLAALDGERGVVVIASDSRTARQIRSESSLEVITVAHYATLDDLLSRSRVRLALYVNYNPLNATMLRFSSVVHVSLLHGDSDKVISVSNQVKAYDLSFVAGQAAIDRMGRYIPYFDAAQRCVAIGRPQLDPGLATPPPVRSDGRVTVLYAPTWEGAQPTAAYGSVDVLGVETVRRIIDDPRLRIVYRPHPLSGVRVPAYGEADAAIREIVSKAQRDDYAAGHRVSTQEELTSVFAEADVLLCDVSAVAMDWLPTGRPLVITDPQHENVLVARTPLIDAAVRLEADCSERVADVLVDEVRSDRHREARQDLTNYYVGSTEPGVALQTFLGACEDAIRRHEHEMKRIYPVDGAGGRSR